jgi:hypothetical protein
MLGHCKKENEKQIEAKKENEKHLHECIYICTANTARTHSLIPDLYCMGRNSVGGILDSPMYLTK